MLTDIIPAKYRRYVYAILTMAAIIIAAIQASDGDWLQVVTYILGALGFTVATANTDTGSGE